MAYDGPDSGAGSKPCAETPAGADWDPLPTCLHHTHINKRSNTMYTQQQLEALEIVAGMIGGVLMEMDDPAGVGGVKFDVLDQIYTRLAGLQRVCSDTIAAAEEGTV